MNAILESVTSAVGKLIDRSFLAAGLAPALILAGGIHLYRTGFGGLDGLGATVTAFTASWAAATWPVLLILVLAFLFLAAKGGLQYLLAEVPLGPVHDALLTRSVARAEALEAERQRWSDRHTALKWSPDGRFVAIPVEGMPGAAPEWKASAARARSAVLAAQADGRDLDPDWVAGLADALLPLQRASLVPAPEDDTPAQVHDADLEAELVWWREWSASPRTERILDVAQGIAEGRMARARRARSAYPQELSWMQPTRFGNRLAALDDYAERRFGMPTAALWTRLWGVLSDKARTEVAEARHAVDALVNVLAALVGVMVWIVAAELHEALGALGPATLAFDLRPLLLLIAAALLARLVYASVLVALGGLRETMIRWIDLERFRLLRELGWPAVAYESDVLDAYSRLNTHLVLGWTLKPDFRVDPTDATK
ncbi:MAG: hypothetical protein R3E98_01905 [Gemmatimonadota bacterium]